MRQKMNATAARLLILLTYQSPDLQIQSLEQNMEARCKTICVHIPCGTHAA